MSATPESSPDWKGYGADQIEAESVVRRVWGDKSFENLEERGDRVGEEGIEVMQALGSSRAKAHAMVDMVFDKSKGEIKQEIAGVTFTLLALCANLGVRMDELFDAEMKRIKAKPEKFYRDKQKVKADLGASIRPE